MESQPRLHEAQTACTRVGFNVTDSKDTYKHPAIFYDAAMPQYGMVSADPNAGLRMPQSRKLVLESFNSGCVNPHGCVNNDGYECTGPVKQMSPHMAAVYEELNRPFAPNAFEYDPPAYVMGIKNNSVNSVTGWQTADNGEPKWKRDAPVQESCYA